MKIIIIGGVAGGMSAATRLRRLDETAEIVVFERGPYVSFANCGLPYYVGGVIEDRNSLLLQTPDSLSARFRLDVRVNQEVVRIDRAAKTVQVTDVLDGTTATEGYDVLILAAGATAGQALPGHGIPVRSLRTVDDVDAITSVLDSVGIGARAVVVGAGFIGLEAIENLVTRGVAVTLVQRGPRPLSPLDPEMAGAVLDTLLLHGVDVRVNSTVADVRDGRVHLDDGSVIETDLIVEARGVRPDTDLARSAGLTIGATGGITVDEYQRTNDPSIYAVGDAVEKTDAIDAAATLVTMAGLANRHGRTAADAIAGVADPSVPALGTAIVGLFGLTIAMVGWSETRLAASGRPHRVVHTHPSSHAGYYPGAEQMSMKLLIDSQTDAILGAQIVGGAGVDKRIDVIATAMAGGLTASQLSRLELAYAPQFGSAKDAVNMAGYVADNLATGATRSIQWHELDDATTSGATLVDVRSADEFARGAIPGAINLPLDDIRARIAELPDTPLVVHCQVGQRGHTAARLLTQLGRHVRNLDGGYRTWLAGTAATGNFADTSPAQTYA
ncbi:CoA-disulfide reductase [Mycetocola manganoxydans]|uniref:CoA-disulfide reductase n=1 Tax=Mycetocola manganoxydans TaxID=699879 RepID=A0A3L6ZS83_9MICO|nr:FAD-dependent oxidoreductase [Mycetocola manganoxydans]RLP70708.1 CoA-disulfide reductase [Mycetocola manganoxydans]GHD48766.1 CoA-disulfide reductase [Mycetocola manganoxydans]